MLTNLYIIIFSGAHKYYFKSGIIVHNYNDLNL